MRKILLTVLALVLVLTVSAAAKQKPSGFGTMDKTLVFTPTVGLTFPSGDFHNVANMGFLVGSNLEYFVAPRVAISFNFNYERFGKPDSVRGDNRNFFFIGGGARGFLFDDAKVNPFGRVAGGLYQGNNQSNVGINFGAGALYRATKNVGVFGEGAIHFVFNYGSGLNTHTATFFGVNGGLSLAIPTGK